MTTAAILLALVVVSPPPPQPSPTPYQEPIVAAVLEDLRKAELLLDIGILEAQVAHSFTLVKADGRIAGAFAFLEPLRRLKDRKGEVRKLEFVDRVVQVYGASAVATYRIDKVWTDEGRKLRQQGWCTDVFERRDDGAWVLVHRQRP